MKIFFTRHGESEANILHEFSNRGLRHPLTQLGRQQANDLAGRLKNRSIQHIYSSPVLRAIETTIIIANHLGIEYEINEALSEFDVGTLEGRSDEQAWQIFKELFDSWLHHQQLEQSVEGGETYYGIRDRFVSFVDQLIIQYHYSNANLLCVSHGGLYWMMLPAILENVDLEFIKQKGLDYTALIVSELHSDGLICTEWYSEKSAGERRRA